MKSEVFGPLNALSPEEYNAIYEKTQIDVDGRKQHLQFNKGTLDNMIKKYINFSHAIPCFSDLPSQDQAKLLKGTNSDRMSKIRQFHRYISSQKSAKY